MTLDWKTAGVMLGIASLILGAGMWISAATGAPKLNKLAIDANTARIDIIVADAKEDRKTLRAIGLLLAELKGPIATLNAHNARMLHGGATRGAKPRKAAP